MSLAEQEKTEHCASCGKPGANKLVTELGGVVLCDSCADRIRTGETVGYWGPAEEEPSPPPEERFGELFKAARVLLDHGIADEDVIYPTLAYASERGQGLWMFEEVAASLCAAEDRAQWGSACEQFLREHGGAVPMDTVDGVVILARPSVDGGVGMYPIPDMEIPEQVVLRILPYTTTPDFEYIASVYESILTNYDVAYGMSHAGSIDFEFDLGALRVTTYANAKSGGRVPREHAQAVFGDGEKPEFLHPRLMAAFCQTLLGTGSGDGFGRLLADRKRGKSPDPVRLIPACVAFYLKEYGGVGRVEAHRLLKKHLPDCVADLPEAGYSNSAGNQLWRDAKKAGQKLLVLARALYEHDPEYTTYRIPRLH